MRDSRAYANLSGRSILMVEDEEVVAEVVKEVVSPLVSDIETASNGEDAMEKAGLRDYDCILLDMKMPRMGGMEFFWHLAKMKPHLAKRIIFITGDTESEATRSFIKTSGCGFLNKPFRMEDLLVAISKMQSEKEAEPRPEYH